MADYYFRSGPNEFGPLTTSQLKKLAAAGRLSDQDEVRKGRSGEWVLAGTVAGVFESPPRPQELAINEMDVLTGLSPGLGDCAPSVPQAERDTAYEAKVTREGNARLHNSHSDLPSRANAGRTRHGSLLKWAKAVGILCYGSSGLGLSLGGFSLLGSVSVTHEILGGVCFLIAIVALACGCAVNLLAAVLARQSDVTRI